MKKTVILFLLTIFTGFMFAAQVSSENLPAALKYHPLGGTIEKPTYPAGSIAVGSPSTSGKGSKSAGIGLSFVSLPNSDETADKENLYMYAVPVSFSYGLSDNMDISISVPYNYMEFSYKSKPQGIGDVIISTSHSYMKQKNFGVGVGFGLTMSLPVGNPEVTEIGIDKENGESNEIDLTLSAKLEKKKGSKSFNCNLSYTLQDLGRNEVKNIFGLGLAVSRGFSSKLAGSLELTTTDLRDENGKYNTIGFLGFRYTINSKMSLSMLLGRNISQSNINYISVTSLSYSM